MKDRFIRLKIVFQKKKQLELCAFALYVIDRNVLRVHLPNLRNIFKVSWGLVLRWPFEGQWVPTIELTFILSSEPIYANGFQFLYEKKYTKSMVIWFGLTFATFIAHCTCKINDKSYQIILYHLYGKLFKYLLRFPLYMIWSKRNKCLTVYISTKHCFPI